MNNWFRTRFCSQSNLLQFCRQLGRSTRLKYLEGETDAGKKRLKVFDHTPRSSLLVRPKGGDPMEAIHVCGRRKLEHLNPFPVRPGSPELLT